jgi:uncharacterized membrane protein
MHFSPTAPWADNSADVRISRTGDAWEYLVRRNTNYAANGDSSVNAPQREAVAASAPSKRGGHGLLWRSSVNAPQREAVAAFAPRIEEATASCGALLILAALFYAGAGLLHFLRTGFYLKIMPPYIPWHVAMVYVSGVAEIAGGIGLLIPRLRRTAAWCLVALLIAVFPANLYMATGNIVEHRRAVPEPPAPYVIPRPELRKTHSQ